MVQRYFKINVATCHEMKLVTFFLDTTRNQCSSNNVVAMLLDGTLDTMQPLLQSSPFQTFPFQVLRFKFRKYQQSNYKMPDYTLYLFEVKLKSTSDHGRRNLIFRYVSIISRVCVDSPCR